MPVDDDLPRPSGFVRLGDVFTPGGIARLTYVERQTVLPAVTTALSTVGYQLLLTGPTGSGKTTHIVNKLWQLFPGHWVTPCETGSTVGDLIEQIIADIGAELTTETVESAERTRRLQASALLGPFSALWAGDRKEVVVAKKAPVARQRPTPHLLGRVLGILDMPWVVDNFHVVSPTERPALADALRVVQEEAAQSSHNGAKVIVLGTGLSSLEFTERRPDLIGRLITVEMPLMDNDELHEVIVSGAEQLNVSISSYISNEIVQLSDGLPGVCHGLCSEVCRAAGIEERAATQVQITQSDFESGLVAYADIQATRFEHRIRRGVDVKLPGVALDGKHVLHELSARGKEDVPISVIKEGVRSHFPGTSHSDVLKVLEALSLPQGGELVHLDSSKEFCRLTEPLIALAFRALVEDVSAQIRARRLANDFRELMQA